MKEKGYMGTAGKLIGYVAILAVALLGAYGIGSAVGPVGQVADGADQLEEGDDHDHGG